MGTLLGTMFGFVSAALLTPTHGDGGGNAMPAAPGVVSPFSLLPSPQDVGATTTAVWIDSHAQHQHNAVNALLPIHYPTAVVHFFWVQNRVRLTLWFRSLPWGSTSSW